MSTSAYPCVGFSPGTDCEQHPLQDSTCFGELIIAAAKNVADGCDDLAPNRFLRGLLVRGPLKSGCDGCRAYREVADILGP